MTRKELEDARTRIDAVDIGHGIFGVDTFRGEEDFRVCLDDWFTADQLRLIADALEGK